MAEEHETPPPAVSPAGIRGLGVDIVEIERMRLALARHPRMRERLFSEAERAYCEKRNKPEIHYAMRFAAKEAVLKAIGTGFRGMRFRDVEVLRDESGRPVPTLHGRAAEVAAERGVVELHLSLSFTHSTAVASAVAITEAHRPRPKDVAPDPMAELAASFKEARSMLDELGEDTGTHGQDEAPEDNKSADERLE
ncbi:MAG: holo-ACP synthase [Coriobacteriia bacterium]|nr:holo-ACP synthase [Coriobacteriia bacterium]